MTAKSDTKSEAQQKSELVLEAVLANYKPGARIYGWEIAKATGLSRPDVQKVLVRLLKPSGQLERRDGSFYRSAA